MKRFILLLSLLSVFLPACRQQKEGFESANNDTFSNPITVSGNRFVDSYGRQVIFSGINKVNKDPAMNYIDNDSVSTFEQFRKWGFNFIRLGVIWDGVEPEPGIYDEKYIDKLVHQVEWASKNGLYVMLDMHQDLYGVSFGEGSANLGDGAPKWATLTDKQPHNRGQVWSDSYLISPAVQKAFDNFWANKPASDGIGLQEHYAKMWQFVAKHFANNKTVVGYDLMNEPFNGSQVLSIMPLLIREYAAIYAGETGKVLSEKEALAMFSDSNRKNETLSILDNKGKYTRFIESGEKLNQEFERTSLQSMYQLVTDAIRAVDTTHILFLEHAYFGNIGMRSGIEPVKMKNNQPDGRVAYAPHGYDLLVDTKEYEKTNNSRVDVMFSRFNETAERLNLPAVVGEWGAFSSNSESIISSARIITSLFGKFGFGNSYWAYYKEVEKNEYFKNAIIRPYTQFTGGTLNHYDFSYETGRFTCSWNESPGVKAPTVIYIPDASQLQAESIILKPAGKGSAVQLIKGSQAGYLVIPVTGDTVGRTIEFKIITGN